MDQKGIFKTGTDSYELTGKNNLISQETAAAYMGGNGNILALYGAARDAFYMDHPDIFYVDFSNLTVRVTSDKNSKYHVTLGAGRTQNYYTKGFSNQDDVESALKEFNAVVEQLVKEASALTDEEGKYRTAEQVKYVHDYLTQHTSYRLENECTKGNEGFIRTAYGSLVRHEGVCEAYTRAMKTVLDRMNIPCIMVQGTYQHSEDVFELHIWNYVKIDGQWYAVDATMDDPISKNPSASGIDGYESTEYLLAGETKMNEHHMPSGVLSEAKYEFRYPLLSYDDFGVDTTEYENGLVVKYKRDGISDEDIPAGEYWISYQNKGCAEAAKNGDYMLIRYYHSEDETSHNPNDWTAGDWAYITPELYRDIDDTPTCLHLTFPQAGTKYIEFGMTDIAPGDYNKDVTKLYYQGSVSHITASSGKLYNPTGTYFAPPYIKTQSPSGTGTLTAGHPYHVTATYTYPLEKTDENQTPGIQMTCQSAGNLGTTTGEIYSKLENFQWDGEATVKFDFTPSEMWADNNVYYTFHLTGLVGKGTRKEPNPIVYGVRIPCCSICYRSQGIDWNVFGKPTLLDNSDMSMNGWKTNENTPIEDLEALKHRMVLVASSPTEEQINTMNDLIEQELGGDANAGSILKSETYNINLTICKMQVIETGQSVRVSIGFPEGYGPDDEGVTFKAYHFTRDNAGKICSIEEIPCTVTRYGLVILCHSFSPYAIAAVKDDGSNTNTDKSVIITHTVGGTAFHPVDEETASPEKINTRDLFTLSKGESRKIQIKADDGYVIDSVLVDGKPRDILTGLTKTELSISYEELEENSCIVDVSFVPEGLQEREISLGQKITVPIAAKATFQSAPAQGIEKTLTEGETLSLDANLQSKGQYTYQWYKDGVALISQTNPTLTIPNVTSSDSGSYQLIVTSFAGATTASSEGPLYRITVKAANGTSGGIQPSGGSPQGGGQPSGGSGGSSNASGYEHIQLGEDPAIVGETPITGDNNHIFIWLFLLLMGIFIITAPIRHFRKK